MIERGKSEQKLSQLTLKSIVFWFVEHLIPDESWRRKFILVIELRHVSFTVQCLTDRNELKSFSHWLLNERRLCGSEKS